MVATKFVSQTLTCNIRDINDAVYVVWKDTDGNEIAENTDGFTINQGTVDGNKVQKSTLTISAAKLGQLDTSSSLTWKCAAQSSKNSSFGRSMYSNVLVTFLTIGKLSWVLHFLALFA